MSKRTEMAETVFVRVLQNSKYIKHYAKTRAVYVIPTGFRFRSSDKNDIVLRGHATHSVDVQTRAFIDQQDSSLKKSSSLTLHPTIFSHFVETKHSLSEYLVPLDNKVWEQNEIQCK